MSILTIFKSIGFTILGAALFCSIYLFRSAFLGMNGDMFKDNIKKNLILYAIIGAIFTILIMQFYR